MLFTKITPFVRYARYMELTSASSYPDTKPCDARLFYAVEGEGSLIAEGKKYNMKRGDLLLFGAGCEYRICPGRPRVNYIVLNFDYFSDFSHLTRPVPPKPSAEFTIHDIIERELPSGEDAFLSPLYLCGIFEIEDTLVSIVREYTRKLLHFEMRASSLLSSALVQCIRAWHTEDVTDGQERLDRIINYIHENYRERLTNSSIGRTFGFHPNYVSELIKRHTGIPLHRYLLSVRLARAIELLNSTDLSVGEIAVSCGFCDIYYFSGFFKESTGLSPLEYRRRNAGI